MGKYRDKLHIIADILSVVKGGAKKTHVMYQANLSYKLLTRYLSEVLEAGFVSFDDEGYYRLTENGKGYLRRWNDYAKRCDLLEEQLNNVTNDKTVLEDMINGDSDKPSKARMRNKRAK